MVGTRLFVYGSLRRGCRHQDKLERAHFEGVSSTRAGYRLVHYEDGYPALVVDGSGKVEGEVYLVDLEVLSELDDFEDCPFLYQRSRIELSDGRGAVAYTIEAKLAMRYPAFIGSVWPCEKR